MNNFGVIEVASTKTTHAPGWAYVPDTPASNIPSQSVSAVHLHVNRNKRAARNNNNNAASSFAVNERHDAKLQKEIDQLQRDSLGGRDAHIPIPSGGHKDKDGKMRGHTANVRKILASQKTFANHLDDFDAWSRTTQGDATAAGGSAGHSASGTPAPSGAPTAAAAASSGAGKKGGNNTTGSAAQKRGAAVSSSSRASKASKSSQKQQAAATATPDVDVSMTDAPPLVATTTTTTTDESSHHARDSKSAEAESRILTPFTRFTPPSHPGDADPLLESWLPPLPTDDELRELMRAPSLNYHQARGTWTKEDKRYPTRHFCEVCGYWGRVRCMKCGTRVCALDCLDVHREECITRYGL